MNTPLDIIWSAVLKHLEKEMSKATYLTLFKNTALLSLDDDIATIAAPSAMIIDLIQKRFLSVLKESLKKELQKEVDILFVPKIITTEQEKKEDDSPLFSSAIPAKPSTIGHLPRVRPDFTFETMAV